MGGKEQVMKWCLLHVGSYFIAELVEAEDKTHKTVVAEVRQLTSIILLNILQMTLPGWRESSGLDQCEF